MSYDGRCKHGTYVHPWGSEPWVECPRCMEEHTSATTAKDRAYPRSVGGRKAYQLCVVCKDLVTFFTDVEAPNKAALLKCIETPGFAAWIGEELAEVEPAENYIVDIHLDEVYGPHLGTYAITTNTAITYNIYKEKSSNGM